MLDKIIEHCPLCDGGPMNLTEHYTSLFCSKLVMHVGVIWISYECESCGDFFSTTESDTISMRRYDIKVRSEFRKLKSNNIFKL